MILPRSLGISKRCSDCKAQFPDHKRNRPRVEPNRDDDYDRRLLSSILQTYLNDVASDFIDLSVEDHRDGYYTLTCRSKGGGQRWYKFLLTYESGASGLERREDD